MSGDADKVQTFVRRGSLNTILKIYSDVQKKTRFFFEKQVARGSVRINPANKVPYYVALNYSHLCPLSHMTVYRMSSTSFISRGTQEYLSPLLRTLHLSLGHLQISFLIVSVCYCSHYAETFLTHAVLTCA